PRSPERRAKILVVDDNEDTARGMSRLLKLLGHDVETAYSGPEAIEVAQGYHPEFILLDIGLPGMDGYEVASRIRREGSCKDSVLIAVSGYGQEDDRRRSREAGFDHHLIKPLDHDALRQLISAGARP
ncbi:response regulator, partial [Singulisphaera rosea]